MILPWRRRKSPRSGTSRFVPAINNNKADHVELVIPSNFICPVSLDLMKDPVTLSTGITYDRQSIETWLDAGNTTCPMTNQHLTSLESIPNHAIRKMIQNWCVENGALGVERVSTPKIPLSASEVQGMAAKLVDSKDDEAKCRKMVGKIRNWAKESEKKRRCIADNGAGRALSSLFHHLACQLEQRNDHSTLLGEILSAVVSISPPPIEMESLSSVQSLESIVWLMNRGDIWQRRDAVLALKRLVLLVPNTRESLVEIGETEEGLVKLIEETDHVLAAASTTKPALAVIHRMIIVSTPDNQTSTGTGTAGIISAAKFVEMGLISLLLELLVDAERSVCEKALKVLDGICAYEQGRRAAYHHALTVPIVVKKILRVSEMATELCISILWNLCKRDDEERAGGREPVVEEALRVGGFQKLLVLLQTGWRGGGGMKEKVNELLKLMNDLRMDHRMVDLVDSMDLKNLKGSF